MAQDTDHSRIKSTKSGYKRLKRIVRRKAQEGHVDLKRLEFCAPGVK